MSDRIEVGVEQVARLVRAQFPQWAHLRIERVEPGGWDNRTFRLGDELSVRMPSAPGYAPAVEKERRWLPILAPELPVPIPEPVANGAPGEGYPLPWTVNRWLPGEPLHAAVVHDPVALARDVAAFLVALRSIDAADGPRAGAHSFHRGSHPSVYEQDVERCRRALAGRVRDDAVAAIWAEAGRSRWSGDPVWFHGDVAPGNLLIRDGRLAAVIDFGTSGVGDPACDTVLAWTWFDGAARDEFLASLDLDAATIARGRAWALWKAMLMLEEDRMPATRAEATRTLRALGAL